MYIYIYIYIVSSLSLFFPFSLTCILLFEYYSRLYMYLSVLVRYMYNLELSALLSYLLHMYISLHVYSPIAVHVF